MYSIHAASQIKISYDSVPLKKITNYTEKWENKAYKNFTWDFSISEEEHSKHSKRW